MWLLFEVGVFMSERFKPGPERSHEEYEPPMSDDEMDKEMDDLENDEK